MTEPFNRCDGISGDSTTRQVDVVGENSLRHKGAHVSAIVEQYEPLGIVDVQMDLLDLVVLSVDNFVRAQQPSSISTCITHVSLVKCCIDIQRAVRTGSKTRVMRTVKFRSSAKCRHRPHDDSDQVNHSSPDPSIKLKY